MPDVFRLKIVSKRQVTIPLLMLEQLHLQEGDELEVEIENGAVVGLRPLKLVPTNFFSDDMLRKLEQRSRSMDAGHRAYSPEPLAASGIKSGTPSNLLNREATPRKEDTEGETRSLSGD
jgi:antitoxin component of MazEF toxin-antitoxin module